MTPKVYDVKAILTLRLETRLPTEGDVQAAVRETIESLGLGGNLTVIATEGRND